MAERKQSQPGKELEMTDVGQCPLCESPMETLGAHLCCTNPACLWHITIEDYTRWVLEAKMDEIHASEGKL